MPVRRPRGWGLPVYTILVFVFLFAPIALVVLFSFNKTAALNQNFGTLSCFSPHKSGSLTIKAGAMAELLGKPTPQNTGSIRLVMAIAGLKAHLAPGQRQLLGAGQGNFAFINLP